MKRNGFALIVNTGVTGLLGFGYWFVAARLFPAAEVGRGSALISLVSLLTVIGTLNLLGTVMRFLPLAGVKGRQFVLTVYGVTALWSLVLSSATMVGIHVFAAPDSPLRLPLWQDVVVCLAVALMCIFAFEDSVLTGLRRASPWVPIENAAFGVLKLALMVVFSVGATYVGLLVSWYIPVVIIVPVVNYFIFRRLLPRNRAGWSPATPRTRKQIRKFVTGDAGGGMFTVACTYALPLIVASTLGAEVNSAFYVALLFASTLDLVGVNLSSAMVVEATHNPSHSAAVLRQSLKRAALLFGPAVVVVLVGANIILSIYGPSYESAALAMRLLVLSCIPKAVATFFFGICRLTHRTNISGAIQAVSCIAIVIGSYVVADHGGLDAIALWILVVQLVAGAAVAPRVLRYARRPAEATT